MVLFITGGSGCGKSEYAENRAMAFKGDLKYIATMPVFSAEDEAKVQRHHMLRKDKGFETLERAGRLIDIPAKDETVLLECMSTHTANITFADEEMSKASEEDIIDFIRSEIEALVSRDGDTIIVSAEVSLDGCEYDEETKKYIRILTSINSYLAQTSDEAVEVVAGIPIHIKEEAYV